MSAYQTAKENSSRNLKGSYAGIVRVSDSDFICDVELSSKRELSASDHKLFVCAYLTPDKVEEGFIVIADKEAYEQAKFRIQFKLGKMFIAKGIYPVGLYMRQVDSRQGGTK
jgi:hypothetical protein